MRDAFAESGSVCAQSSMKFSLSKELEISENLERHGADLTSDIPNIQEADNLQEEVVMPLKSETVKFYLGFDNGKVAVQKVQTERLVSIHKMTLNQKSRTGSRNEQDSSFMYCKTFSLSGEVNHDMLPLVENTVRCCAYQKLPKFTHTL